jgi:hypothetical protein
MYKNLSSRGDQATAQSFQFWKALWQLPLQYINIFIKPSVNTLSEVMGKANWWLVLVQFLSLFAIMGTISFIGLVVPSAALHDIATLNIGFVRPLGWLPFPLNEITLFPVSFIGLGIAYVCSKVCGGQGTFLAHLYCLLVCTIPLVTVSGVLLLLPAPGWLAQVLGGIVSTLFIYRMVLHTFTIMAVHRLRADQAIIIVLVLPITILAMIVIISLLSNMHGEWIGDLLGDCLDIGTDRRREKAAGDSIMR